MCFLVTEYTTTKSAIAVVLLVARHRVAATGRVEFFAEVASWVLPDTVRPIPAIGRSVASTSFPTVLVLLVRTLSTFPLAS